MRIGIDISQIVYEGTGVARYVSKLVESLIDLDDSNEYILFASTLRKSAEIQSYYKTLTHHKSKISLKIFPFPPMILHFLWNVLHIIPIEFFIGPIDIFWSSDWTQPPLLRAKGVTTVFDMAYLRYPEETNPKTSIDVQTLSLKPNIVMTQKLRMQWVVRECKKIICESNATKMDIVNYLGVQSDTITVIYPGITL